MLFIQGNRDHLTDPDELQPILDSLGDRATLRVVEGADHFHNLPENSGMTRHDAMLEAAADVSNWMGASI